MGSRLQHNASGCFISRQQWSYNSVWLQLCPLLLSLNCTKFIYCIYFFLSCYSKLNWSSAFFLSFYADFVTEILPSVLWHCWLGVRKSIWPVKLSDEVLMWLSVWNKVQIVCIWSSWCLCHTKTPSSLASFESRLVLPFWYQLTQIVLEKRSLNGCGSNSSSSSSMFTEIWVFFHFFADYIYWLYLNICAK